jgi:hypothetical protein
VGTFGTAVVSAVRGCGALFLRAVQPGQLAVVTWQALHPLGEGATGSIEVRAQRAVDACQFNDRKRAERAITP